MRYDDGSFGSTPYDKILGGIHMPAREPEEYPRTGAASEDEQEKSSIEENSENLSQIGDEITESSIEAGDSTLQTEENMSENVSAETENTEAEVPGDVSEAEYKVVNSTEEMAVPHEERKQPAVYEKADLDAILADTVKTEIANDEMVLRTIDFTDVHDEKQVKIYIEEDILVPDIKPDLASILSMSGSISCNERELKTGISSENPVTITGDINLKTIYVPEKAGNDPIISIQSRIPFRAERAAIAPALTKLSITPTIEKAEYSVINERKFRAKLTVTLNIREYIKKRLDIFEGIVGEEIQLLKEKMTLTDIAARKTDTLELKEMLAVKENMPEPLQILKYDIRIAENNKQITAERAVVGGSIYYSILYLAKQDNEDKTAPFMCQGHTEFTQFIALNSQGDSSGSRVSFDASDITIRINTENSINAEGSENEDENGYSEAELRQEQGRQAFVLEGNIVTTVEISQNLKTEIATDIYHNEKELVFESEELVCGALVGNGVTEISVREILNVPQEYGDIDRVVFVSGKPTDTETSAEYGKQSVSGKLEAEVLVLAADESGTLFKLSQSIPFRGSMDIANAENGMTAECDMRIKELRCDKINNRQIEVTASVLVCGAVYSKETQRLIKNPAFMEIEESNERKPSIVIYIAKKDDSLWSIAKSFRTTMEKIIRVNTLAENSEIKEGMRLLVIK